jgi:hypothetical protein
MNTEHIQDYILVNQKNLAVAAAVVVAWPDARERIVSGFLGRLQLQLTAELKGWKFGRESTIYVDEYATYYFLKPEWAGDYGLKLQWGKYGVEMVLGVYWVREKVGKRPHCDDLLCAVKEKFPSAKSNPWYEARVEMKTPASDWRSPEIMWRMHTDATFLNSVAEQLLDLAKISEPFVDRLVKDYPKAAPVARP